MKTSSVSRRDSSSSMLFTSRIKPSRPSTILTVGRRSGGGDVRGKEEGATDWEPVFRVLLIPKPLIIDLDLENLGRGSSMADCDCVGMCTLFSSAGVGVGWEDDGIRNQGTYTLVITLTGNIELLAFG